MNEVEIAEKHVIPFLEGLGWSRQLITKYGRVPIQMGTEVKYADIVAFFIDNNDIAFPYLVVEVKRTIDNLEEVEAQANSYSKQLDTQIFVVTDGSEYKVYQRSLFGGYIRINDIPVPEKTHLTPNDKTDFKFAYVMCEDPPLGIAKFTVQFRVLEREIEDFFDLVAENRFYVGTNGYSLRRDITGHYKNMAGINELVHSESDLLTSELFKSAFENYVMCEKKPNVTRIYDEVDNNFDKVKQFLKFIGDFEGNPQENLTLLFDKNSEVHVNGMGPFIISQFLAGAHPMEYTIIEDRMVNTMKDHKLIDVRVHPNTPKGYLYINDMCKRLLNDLFKRKIEERKDTLGFEVEDDLGLVVMHEFFWEYGVFFGYDKSKLQKATGEELKYEKERTESHLNEIRRLKGQSS